VRTRVLISLAAAVFILGANGAAHARRVSNHVSYSLTRAWAGFVERADGRAFTRVRATWTLPRIVCNQPSSSVAFWVGLGGATSSSRALEQIGTAVDCSDRAAVSYSAWYEAYPARAVDLPIVVRRGDTVTAEVRVAGKRVAVTLVNDSTGVSFAKHFTMPAPEAALELLYDAASMGGSEPFPPELLIRLSALIPVDVLAGYHEAIVGPPCTVVESSEIGHIIPPHIQMAGRRYHEQDPIRHTRQREWRALKLRDFYMTWQLKRSTSTGTSGSRCGSRTACASGCRRPLDAPGCCTSSAARPSRNANERCSSCCGLH
jgi:hypothetical protein